MSLSAILPDKAVRRLIRGGKAYARDIKRAGMMQMILGRQALAIWENTPGLAEELRKEDFYAECSQWINSGVEFPVVSVSGETLRRWSDVAKHYRTFPNIEVFESVLSFDHFDNARTIGSDPTNILTSAEALALAVEHDWTAGDMRRELSTKHETNPEVLQIRSQFAPWLGRMPDVLLSLNKNRQQAEYHLREFERLVSEGK